MFWIIIYNRAEAGIQKQLRLRNYHFLFLIKALIVINNAMLL